MPKNYYYNGKLYSPKDWDLERRLPAVKSKKKAEKPQEVEEPLVEEVVEEPTVEES